MPIQDSQGPEAASMKALLSGEAKPRTPVFHFAICLLPVLPALIRLSGRNYIGNISRVDDRQNANNHRVNSEFDRWLSRSLYLILPFAEYYKDPFQNLQHRLTGGVGVGYDIQKVKSQIKTIDDGAKL